VTPNISHDELGKTNLVLYFGERRMWVRLINNILAKSKIFHLPTAIYKMYTWCNPTAFWTDYDV